LGDTAERDYTRKLQRFNAFAEPELRQAIASLNLQRGMHILDAGCGTGEALCWLSEAAGSECVLTGIDLSTAHVAAARARAPRNARVLQADLTSLPFDGRTLDLIWCANTINHVHEPVRTLQAQAAWLRAGGRIALGQSSLLPDMYFAWDARLERLTNEAVRQYYRERYRLTERDLTSVRSLVGLLRRAGLTRVTARSFIIERISPLNAADEAYLLETIFQGTFGERLRPYLSEADYAELTRLCDPGDPQFALRRPEFHFLQTFTLAVGAV
jgi:ubiquinone/menaquinone biosynthesis C-methylase UbiE